MPDSGDTGGDQRLKAALWYALGKAVDAVAVESNTNASPAFIAGLTEMVAANISQSSADLEAFARHAGRTTVDINDVVLLARHNEALRDVLCEKADRVRKRDQSVAN